MALFGFGKKKKKPQEAPGSPIEQIMVLKQQGMDNNQIIQELESQGYNSSQIFDALNQANISGAAMGPEQPPGYSKSPPQQDLSYEQPPLQEPQPKETLDKEQIEEMIEVIVNKDNMYLGKKLGDLTEKQRARLISKATADLTTLKQQKVRVTYQ